MAFFFAVHARDVPGHHPRIRTQHFLAHQSHACVRDLVHRQHLQNMHVGVAAADENKVVLDEAQIRLSHHRIPVVFFVVRIAPQLRQRLLHVFARVRERVLRNSNALVNELDLLVTRRTSTPERG